MQRVHRLALAMWLLATIAISSAAIPKAAVQSRDLLVFTAGRYDDRNGGAGGGLLDIKDIKSLGIAVLSPAGNIKAKITLPYRAPTVGEFATRSYKEIKPALALSADGNYAYLSASMPGNAKQMGLYVIRIKGGDVKVEKTIALPESKSCQSPQSGAAIAVDSLPSKGRQDLYVSRVCGNASTSKNTSTDVLKLRYTFATGALTAFPQKPYYKINSKTDDKDTTRSSLQLGVVEGIPYGLFSTNQKWNLLKLGGSMSSTSFRASALCDFAIASASQLFGKCGLNLVSVTGTKLLQGPMVPFKDSYRIGYTDGPIYTEAVNLPTYPRYVWEGRPAISAQSRILYTVLGDEVTYNNKTLYKWNGQNLGSSPKAVFKLPSPVVLLPKKENSVVVVLELHIIS